MLHIDWSILLSVVSILVALAALSKRKLYFLLLLFALIFAMIFLKPLILWGVEKNFIIILHLESSLSLMILLIAFISSASHNYPYFKNLPSTFWELIFCVASPFIGLIVTSLLRMMKAPFAFTRLDFSDYIMKLSSSNKISLEDFYIMINNFEATIFYILGLVQLLSFAKILHYSIPRLMDFQTFDMWNDYYIIRRVQCRNYVSGAIFCIGFLSTNLAYAFCLWIFLMF